MRVEISTKKLEREAEENEVSVESLKYEKYWAVIVERLIEALKDENKYVRWGAAGALGELGDVRAVEPLIEALKDKDSNVREMVTCALEKIGNCVTVEPQIRVPKDEGKGDFGEEEVA